MAELPEKDTDALEPSGRQHPVSDVRYLFRSLDAQSLPGPGEVFFRWHCEPHATPALASQVLAPDFAGLRSGEGTPRAIVLPDISIAPTLDDMLAACILRLRLRGQTAPEGLAAFAAYAGRVRQGFRGGAPALAGSLEGIFLAVRNAESLTGKRLSDPRLADRFLIGWQRLERHILAAAEKGEDPAHDDLFGGYHFAQQRCLLDKDLTVYQGDVARGKRWVGTVPGRADPVSVLMIDRPQSLCFKQWSRNDAEAPTGGRYQVMGVRWNPQLWVFSSDPREQISLRPLWRRLQAAEEQTGAEPGSGQPRAWFDGSRHHYTLLTTPRGGSQLPDERIEQIFAEWLQAVDHSEYSGREMERILKAWPALGVLRDLGSPSPSHRDGHAWVFAARDPVSGPVTVRLYGVGDARSKAVEQKLREQPTALHVDACQARSEDPRRRYLCSVRARFQLNYEQARLHCEVVAETPCRSLSFWRSQRETLRIEEVASLVAGAAAGVALLHGWGVSHRDLHPETIDVEDRGDGSPTVRLAGFGCHRRGSCPSRELHPQYAPPDLQEDDPRYDVFSLAVLAVFVIRGELSAPFREGGENLLGAEVLEPARRARTVCDATEAWYQSVTELLLRATAFDPLLRPTADVFARTFLEISRFGIDASSRNGCVFQKLALLPALGSSEEADEPTLVGTPRPSVAQASCVRCQQEIVGDSQFCGVCGARIRPAESTAAWSPLVKSHDLVGQRIGSYRLDQLLDEGAGGAVFRATQTSVARQVALKLLRPELSRALDMINHFKSEARFLGRFQHPHIVPIFDMFEAGGFFCISMQLADGGSVLQQIKQNGPLPSQQAASYTRQAALALAGAFQFHIVHSDVKPANLLLCQGVVKLADFGIAHQPRAGCGREGIFGTPAYMAPEQWDGPGHTDHRSDLYGLGCTLYHMLSGEPPFGNADPSDPKSLGRLLVRHIQGVPENLRACRPELPAGLHALVAALMAKEPEDRPADGLEVARRLEPLCLEEG